MFSKVLDFHVVKALYVDVFILYAAKYVDVFILYAAKVLYTLTFM